jgi:signal peptidase
VLGTVVLVAVAALGVATRPGPDGVGRLAGHPVLTIVSGSMSPAFDTGDAAVDRVVASETTTLHSGDVITFRAPAADGATSSVLITHRITAVIRSAGGATLYATRGDHNQTDDPAPVPASNVVAVYQFHVPVAGCVPRRISGSAPPPGTSEPPRPSSRLPEPVPASSGRWSSARP